MAPARLYSQDCHTTFKIFVEIETGLDQRFVEGLFDRSILYLISPYDSVAHVGQALIGTNVVYDHPWIWSLASVVAINAIALYVLSVRVSSMEVTRE